MPVLLGHRNSLCCGAKRGCTLKQTAPVAKVMLGRHACAIGSQKLSVLLCNTWLHTETVSTRHKGYVRSRCLCYWVTEALCAVVQNVVAY